MAIYSSASTRAFFDDTIHTTLPGDAVQITAEAHAALMAGQATGSTIDWGVDGVPVLIAPATPTAAELLAAERAGMNPFHTAFRFAMKQTPATGYAHLLDRVTQAVAAARAADPFSDLVIWADSVTQIVRLHPDMTYFATLFDLTPEGLDDLCRLAMQIEALT